MDIIIFLIVLMVTFGAPAIRKLKKKASVKMRLSSKRSPSDFGAIELDSIPISVKGRGVTDPKKMTTQV